jgi:hypothetical protein
LTAEFSRPTPVSKVAGTGVSIVVHATPVECAALASRMGIPAMGSLECHFDLTAAGDPGTIHARGNLRSIVTLICVVSTEEFETRVEEAFEIHFVPAGRESHDPDPNLPDEIPYQWDAIDLGEAAAEQLGLALDPYPRMDGAQLPEIEDEANGSPFAVLSRLGGPDKK